MVVSEDLALFSLLLGQHVISQNFVVNEDRLFLTLYHL